MRESVNHAAPSLDLAGGVDADPQQKIDFYVHLPLRDSAGLDRLLVDLYDPVAPDYLKFLSRNEFARRFLPTGADANGLMQYLRSHGFEVAPSMQGASMRVSGSVEQARKAFGVTLKSFYDNAQKMRVRSADGDVQMSSPLPIRAIHGVSTSGSRVNHVKKPHADGEAAVGQAGFSAADIRRAYGFPENLTGKGQKIGFVQLDGYLDADLDAYARANNIRRVPTRRVLIGGHDGDPSTPSGQTETTLDIELANAMAPDAEEFVVYTAKNDTASWHAMLNEIANPADPKEELVKYISCSWGTPEDQMGSADVLAEHDLLRQMAAQGQFFAAASGDSGDKADGAHIGTDDPASQPWSLAVGGTNLSLNAQRTRQGETAWSGSGGGVSCYWPNPSWQDVRVGDPYIDDGRNVPDVSLHSDAAGPSGSYAVIVNGRATIVGGTSCAAPLWTAIAAGVGSMRADEHKPTLGAWGPHIHRLGMSAQSDKIFFHIDQGDNGAYRSSPETDYDNVCGWGSPRGVDFVRAMVAR